jgi:hypothetical protein
MGSRKMLVGMQGVYLVAAELSRHGYIAAPTSRGAKGADILVTDTECQHAFTVQVKTNSAGTGYWLLSAEAKSTASPTYIYVFVALQPDGCAEAFYVVPSWIVRDKSRDTQYGDGRCYSFAREDAEPYRDKWSILMVIDDPAHSPAGSGGSLLRAPSPGVVRSRSIKAPSCLLVAR